MKKSIMPGMYRRLFFSETICLCLFFTNCTQQQSATTTLNFDKEKETGKFPGKSLETCILEMENGEWKIAYLGFHYYPMKGKVK